MIVSEFDSFPVNGTALHTVAEGAQADADQILTIINLAILAARPAVQQDGGDIEFVSFSDDIVRVRLSGACTHCHMAGQTLGTIRRQIVKATGRPLRVLPALQQAG